jgi:hypothetical protein
VAVTPTRRRSASPSRAQAMKASSVAAPICGDTANAVSKVPATVIGAKSFSGSSGKVATVARSAIVVDGMKAITEPSAAVASRSASPAAWPVLPGRFSTATRRPSRRSSFGAMLRAIRSAPPLATKPTTMRRPLSGSVVCARAAPGTIAGAASKRVRRSINSRAAGRRRSCASAIP